MRKMSQIRHAQPQITDHPIMERKRDTCLRMIDFARTVQNLGRHVSKSPAQPSIHFCRPQDSSH